ncbi:hypothetical protein CARUB_v10011577mg [Capsella rubella]|uniref:Uncharacterized protein n=1 Tax=Capsella rubella TaxID=81985 RepID=R0GNV3_9BRAS|nr:uncharacterized protein LOC17897197 [Capsella rubella]EOA37466.1 hypothetical protein CARUB_v10011577mg [Capsella rubella]
MSIFIPSEYESAVDDLLSQAKDLYVLEQVAKINCAGFTDDDSVLPTNLETRLRRLKSLPVSRPKPVSSSSSRKLLSHSKSMASYVEKKNRGNVSSFSNLARNDSCPLDSSVEETRILPCTKLYPSVNSRFELGETSDSRRIGSSSSSFSRGNVSSVSDLSNFSRAYCPLDSGRIGSSSSRISREGNILTPTTQTLKLLPKETSRTISSHSSTSTDLASPSSDQDQKEGMDRKSKLKSKFLSSWFDKLSPAKTMSCFRRSQDKSSPNSKKTTVKV